MIDIFFDNSNTSTSFLEFYGMDNKTKIITDILFSSGFEGLRRGETGILYIMRKLTFFE
jgi:hypothetical protein